MDQVCPRTDVDGKEINGRWYGIRSEEYGLKSDLFGAYYPQEALVACYRHAIPFATQGAEVHPYCYECSKWGKDCPVDVGAP